MLYALPYKTKKIFILLIKWTVVIGAFYFIYNKLSTNNNGISLQNMFGENKIFSAKTVLILLTLSFFNWVLEIKKWHLLTHHIHPISFTTACKQTLSAFTGSIISPNRIADYAIKALHFPKGLRKKSVALNVVNHFFQMLVTVVFGVIGLSCFVYRFNIEILYPNRYIIVSIISILLIAICINKKTVRFKQFSLQRLLKFIATIPLQLKLKVAILSVIRYVLFSFQFYYLLHLFNAPINLTDAYIGITSTYLLASLVPIISFFDALIKGSVALFIFNYFGINSTIVSSTILVLWILNTAIPLCIGSYFVLTFNVEETKNRT